MNPSHELARPFPLLFKTFNLMSSQSDGDTGQVTWLLRASRARSAASFVLPSRHAFSTRLHIEINHSSGAQGGRSTPAEEDCDLCIDASSPLTLAEPSERRSNISLMVVLSVDMLRRRGSVEAKVPAGELGVVDVFVHTCMERPELPASGTAVPWLFPSVWLDRD